MQSQTRRARPVVVLLVIIVVLLTSVLVTPVRRGLTKMLTAVTQPLTRASQATLERLGISSSFQQPADNEQIRAQLEAVTRELSDARQEIQSRQTADQLGQFLGRSTFPTVPAAVVGYSPDPGIQSLVINVGHDQGLKLGQAVVTGDGWMIGKISAVHEVTSVVLLLTDTQSLVLASIQNTVLSQGVIRGERGLAAQMDLIPKNDVVTVGQAVVTSGLEPGVPPDLLVGTIAKIEQRSGEVFQRARLSVPIRYGRVRQVAVIRQ